MAIDVSLVAVPKEAIYILTKAASQPDSEYSEAVFALPQALKNKFTDFGHPDWMALQKDAEDLLQYYPKQQFDAKFYCDTNRTFEVFDYLFAKKENSAKNFKDAIPFFYDGILHPTCVSGQGFPLCYWDLERILAKKALLEAVSFESLLQLYDAENMMDEGVYKIAQFAENFQDLQQTFTQIKQFLMDAAALKGYVLVMKY